MEATSAEVLSRDTAELLFYLHGDEVPDWVMAAATAYYGNHHRVDELVWMLCASCREMSDEERETKMYDGRNPSARKLADWWDRHKEADEKREKEKSANAAWDVTFEPLWNGKAAYFRAKEGRHELEIETNTNGGLDVSVCASPLENDQASISLPRDLVPILALWFNSDDEATK